MTAISVIIPVLNEAAALPGLLATLREDLDERADEIVVVDGGSADQTAALALSAGAVLVRSPSGRGRQLAAGAAVAQGDLLWFLHADTGVPSAAVAALRSATAQWGCFYVRIDSADPRLALTAHLMNERARRGGSCTGDMGMWFRRSFYEDLQGFASLPLLEDLDLSDRARARADAQVLRPALSTSARRWEQHGMNRTVMRLWAIRLAYRLGVSPDRLARFYRRPAR